MGKVMQVLSTDCEEKSRNMWATPAESWLLNRFIFTWRAAGVGPLGASASRSRREVGMEDPGTLEALKPFRKRWRECDHIPVMGDGTMSQEG